MENSIDRHARRIARLERTNRILISVFGVSLLLFLMAAASEPTTVRATAFQLLDKDGAVRAELVTRNGSPGLYLKDKSGLDRVAVFDEPDGSGVYVMDTEGVTRIGLAQFAHGGGGLALHGRQSEGAAVLYLKQAGSLRFFDKNGQVTNQVLAAPVALNTGHTGEAVVRAYVEAYNAHDVDRMLSFMVDGIRWMSVAGEAITIESSGKGAVGSSMSGYFDGLPSARSELRRVISVGNYVSTIEESMWESDGEERSQCALATYELSGSKIVNVWYHAAQPCGDDNP